VTELLRATANSRELPILWAADLLQPLWRAAMEAVLDAKVLHLDCVEWPVLDGSRAGWPRLGSLWGLTDDEQTAFYLYASVNPGEGELGLKDLLARHIGHVMVDDPGHFKRWWGELQPPDFTVCGCNLRTYRHFLVARVSGSPRSAVPLPAFESLYAVEKEMLASTPESRRARRQVASKPTYDSLVRWCRQNQPDELPTSPLGQAFSHVLENETELRRFLDDGLIPIDNTIFERLHARLELARGPSFLASSEADGQRAAVALTVWSSCLLAEVDPSDYLRDVLPLLSRGVPPARVAGLLPARWRASS
jgi:transposase